MTNTYICTTVNPGNQISKVVSRIRFGLFAFVLFAFGLSSNAQVSTYTFSQSAGTYTPIAGGTVLGTPTNDDNIFANNPIGFSFCYNGAQYTEFGVCANGWIYMGNSTGTSSYVSISNATGTNNLVSAFNYDIQGEPTTGDLRFQTIGVSPNRTLIVQWTNYDHFSSTTNTDNYNFQIRLNETSNQIDVVYGAYTCNAAFYGAQVGLRGASAADYNNLSISNGLQTWATPIAGTANTATCEVNNTPLVPASGQTYSWAQPAAPVSPINLVFSPVTSTAMTLTWDDNSTNEATFYVYRSLDNITFTLVNTQASTSVATTGTPYTYNATGLFSNQIYYWRIFAGNANCGGTPLTGNQTTLAGTMCGTYSIGPTGAYTSLTAAVAAVVTNGVNCPLIFEFQAAYVSTVETFPIVIPFLGNGPAATITARPELGATNLSITSAATQTIDFSGSSYFSFDGRPGGLGTVSHLTIANTSTTGNAIRFINDAQFDGINYINVRGVTTATTTGVIAFGNAVTSTGNSNNFITNSDLTSGASGASILVYSANATANTTNNNNTISNNLFYNWFGAAATDAAISVTGNSANWTISNNSFYQTANRTYTSAVIHNGININTSISTLTGGFVVTGNSIGGTAANCGGTAWTDLGAIGHRFIALNVTTGTSSANSIQGNTIRNFTFTTTSGITTTNGIWCGINLTGTGAIMNVGTITPNVIGSNTVNGQIVTSTSTTGGMTVGINSSATGTITISNNQIGGITANSSAGTISTSINGILISGGLPVITNNVIGSTTLASSLINAVSVGATGGHITGINSSTGTGAVIITGNTIANLTNQYAGTSTTGQVRGIVSTSGSNTISGNTISALTNLAPQTGTTTTASVIGIGLQSTSTAVLTTQKVFGNTIVGLANGSPTGNVQVNGILVNSSTTAGYNYEVYNNSVQALGAPLTSGTSLTAGIQIYGGIGRVYNNMIVLGIDALGNAVTQNQEYDGIYKNTVNRGTVTFNSVSIAGTGVAAGTNNTYAFRRASGPGTAPVDSVYSNIFSNTRSNGAGTGTHYSISINNTTGILSNGNDFYGNGTGYQMGAVGATPYASVAAWSGATTFDANSYGADPFFTSALNLHITNPSQTPLESRATAMNLNFDFDNQVRPGPTAVNGGGTGPDIGADEFDGFPVTVDVGISVLVSPATSGCHSATDSIRVRLVNNAGPSLDMSVNNVVINASVTGPNPQVFGPVTITSGIIPGGGFQDITIALNYNMTAVGTYVFNANATQVNDFVTSNDAMAPVTIIISAGTASATPSPQCSGSNTTISVSGQTNGATIQWQSSPDNITWTNIAGATTSPYTVNPTDTTFYRTVSCGLHNSIQDTVLTIDVAPATTTNDTICGPGVVNLAAAGSGPLNWYTAITGGTPINVGATYSPSILATTTYYVENTFSSGASGTPAGPICYPAYTSACSSADIINDVFTTGGTTNISNMGTGCNGTLPSNTTFFPAQIVTSSPGGTFTLNVQSGASWSQGFRLFIDYNNDGDFVDVGEDVWSSPTSSTALYTTPITVPVSATPGPKRMRLIGRFATIPVAGQSCTPPSFSFGETEEYTLMVSLLCSATRTPVTGVVTPPPTVTLTAANSSLCGTDSTLIVASSSNPNYAYAWSPATYLSSTTNDSVMFVPAIPGFYNYQVTATDIGTGCTYIDTVSVSSSLAPAFTLAADNDSICAGSSAQLNVVLPSAAVPITNGNVLNTTTTYPAPYGNWYGGARHQMLILASELTAAGLSAGYLNGMRFQITNIGTSAALQNFTIEMMPTAITDITAFQAGPFQTVYTNALYMPTVGLNVHNFSSNYYWDGVSNIIVQTCFNNLTFTQNCVFRQTTTTFNSTVYYRNDNEPGVCTNNAVTGFIMQRPNIAFLRSSGSLAYAWSPVASLSNPTSDTTMATPATSTTYYMTVTDTLTGCATTDSINIHVLPTPMPMLGSDTAICSNTTLLLDGSAGNHTYLWNDMSTNQTLNVSAFGVYDVFVTDTLSGCTGTDTVLIGINAAPLFSLGSDAVICAGNSVSFSGPGGQYDYAWSTLETTQAITTGTAGSYVLVLTDTINACFNSDTVALVVNALPVVTLGSDYAVCSANAPAILTAPSGNYTYIWSDASTNDSLAVNATGSYYVTVTDTATTCYSGDTIVITVNSSPVVALGADSTFCSASGPITLSGPAGPFDYLWSDATTNMTLNTNTSGVYAVTVTDSITGCATADTVNITVNTSPVVNLGADTTTCGATVTLDAQNAGSNYLWNDNSTLQTLTASTSGTYSVDVTAANGCVGSDAVQVTVNANPTVTFTPQSNACVDDAAITLTGSPAGGTFSGPGVTGNSFSPVGAGVGVQVVTYSYTDVNGCSASANANITVSACVGVTEPFVAAGMNVFPNPNNGSFTLTINDADYSEITMELVTIEGQVISSDKASNVKGVYVKQLDLSTHANGIYFLRVTANGQMVMQKIVKQD